MHTTKTRIKPVVTANGKVNQKAMSKALRLFVVCNLVALEAVKQPLNGYNNPSFKYEVGNNF